MGRSDNAGRDIKIVGYGILSAKSVFGVGGGLVVLAKCNLTFESNSAFDVSSAQRNAEVIELSAKNKASIGIAIFNLAATGRLFHVA